MMRIGVLLLSEVEDEEVFARPIEAAGMERVKLNESTNLAEIDGFLLVGKGELLDLAHDPLVKAIHLQSERGKPVLGFGLGAQLLVERGFVPGLENNKPAIKLIDKYSDSPKQFMRLTHDYQRNAFTKKTTLQDIYPLAPFEAPKCFVMSSVLYDEIKHQGLNVWLYCDEKGEVINREVEMSQPSLISAATF